jgi:sugar lactone lactonase YvrE
LVQRPVGNLAIQVGIPAGIALRPNVSIIGPRGFARPLSTSELLSGLIPGSYSAVANPEVSPGTIVSTVYAPHIRGSPAQVAPGGTAIIDVAYNARRGSGHLWVVDAGSVRLRAYGGGSLSSPGTVSAGIIIGSGESGYATSGVLAADGDVCVLLDPFTLARYTSGHLESGATPDVVLGNGREGGWMNYVLGLAFDPSGNLWLASNAPTGATDRRILKFSASRLRATDPNPTPDVIIRGPSNWYPAALAFDRAGNLWAADFMTDRLVKFSPSQLLSDGAPAPSTIISNVAPSNPLSHPIDLAFDADGNLWSSNLGGEQSSELVMYTATQALAGGSPNPAIRIARPTLRNSRGLAFDGSGGLWMAIPGALARFSRSQLSGGGAPTPQIIQDSSLVIPVALMFNPPPSGIPLYR